MKILFLGNDNSQLITYLRLMGDEVISISDRISLNQVSSISPDFIISYGYRYLIEKNIIQNYVRKIINLHISYLPWNRGADPNFWSFFDHTPKGVTIHYVDEGIDTGDIILQELVDFDCNETLRTSYNKLQNEIQKLFIDNWHAIKVGNCKAKKQTNCGSYHKTSDKQSLIYILNDGWDTPVSIIANYKFLNKYVK